MDLEVEDYYQVVMNEIKNRIFSAEILSNERENAIFIEATTLQIRKIIELIAYLSLVLNREKVNRKIRNKFQANLIINAISDKTKIFFPFPSYIIPPNKDNKEAILIPIGYKNSLSQNQIIDIYKKCGKILHAQHPYEIEIDFKQYKLENKIILNKLKNLLQNHTIGIKHENNRYTFLYVTMDFSKENPQPTVLREYKTNIFSEEKLQSNFNLY